MTRSLPEHPTTAALLISYRKELVEGGISHDVADRMVCDAGQALLSTDAEIVVRRNA